MTDKKKPVTPKDNQPLTQVDYIGNAIAFAILAAFLFALNAFVGVI